ncbi:Rossmann-fold NAD(P)-binding domain-containing protein [Paracoccus aminovorans]|uniref:hypothetical protein n=1 Tax=Paracoccus aminovorans TaxID=34004 RepID=UPI002B26063B|nr:hypothetical protein [Paracoccus aminovorans]
MVHPRFHSELRPNTRRAGLAFAERRGPVMRGFLATEASPRRVLPADHTAVGTDIAPEDNGPAPAEALARGVKLLLAEVNLRLRQRILFGCAFCQPARQQSRRCCNGAPRPEPDYRIDAHGRHSTATRSRSGFIDAAGAFWAPQRRDDIYGPVGARVGKALPIDVRDALGPLGAARPGIVVPDALGKIGSGDCGSMTPTGMPATRRKLAQKAGSGSFSDTPAPFLDATVKGQPASRAIPKAAGPGRLPRVMSDVGSPFNPLRASEQSTERSRSATRNAARGDGDRRAAAAGRRTGSRPESAGSAGPGSGRRRARKIFAAQLAAPA